MSLCRTCEYALYDGMCMAHGKFTLLDAPACDDYKMHLDVEVSKLKAENAKLREMCRDLYECASESAYSCPNTCKHWNENEYCCSLDLSDRMRDLGIEVDG